MFFRGLTLLGLLGFSSGCLGPIKGLYPPAPGKPIKTIYVLNHGWHTGLVIPTDSLRKESLPPNGLFKNRPFVEIGWGDEGFYTAGRITVGLSVQAMLWPTTTVLHCVAVDRPVQTYFGTSGIIKVELSQEGFDKLLDFVSSSYKRDSKNAPIDIGPGIYGASRFYRATGKYYFPNTCNKWTARALRAAGCPISPFYAVRSENVFNQTSKFGTVLREFNSD